MSEPRNPHSGSLIAILALILIAAIIAWFMASPHKPAAALWCTVALVAVLVGYPLSSGPVGCFVSAGCWDRLYAPLTWGESNGSLPGPFATLLQRTDIPPIRARRCGRDDV